MNTTPDASCPVPAAPTSRSRVCDLLVGRRLLASAVVTPLLVEVAFVALLTGGASGALVAILLVLFPSVLVGHILVAGVLAVSRPGRRRAMLAVVAVAVAHAVLVAAVYYVLLAWLFTHSL